MGWAGKFHVFFAAHGYTVVFAQYGKQFNDYMGVMLAWPTSKYEAVDVEISRVADTAPKGTYPAALRNETINPHGMLTEYGMREVLGCRPPEKAESNENFEWNTAKDRMNEVVLVKLRPRLAPQK